MPVTLYVHATPKARHSEIIGWAQDADGKPLLKVRLKAPPEDGKANAELIRLLAKTLGIAKSAITLERGGASRHKCLIIHDNSASSALSALPAVIKA